MCGCGESSAGLARTLGMMFGGAGGCEDALVIFLFHPCSPRVRVATLVAEGEGEGEGVAAFAAFLWVFRMVLYSVRR